MEKTQVLIAGAGPSGLMMANQLIRHGIEFMIVDKGKGITPFSKALAVHARTLEIYGELGIAAAAIEQGRICRQISMTVKGDIIGTVNLGTMGEGKSPYPYMLVLEQSKNEQLLESLLHAKGKAVQWQTEMVDFIEDSLGLTVTLKTAEGELCEIRCDYLASCEGARSVARRKLNIDFAGGTYDSYNFVADLQADWSLPYDQTYTCLSEDTFAAFFPMPGERRYRMVGIVPDELVKDEKALTFDALCPSILKKLGLQAQLTDVTWFSVYKAHHRRAEQFSKGRVFLVGDASHIHSPAGGQGMNTGLQDAYNLAWKLAFVLRGWTASGLLDTYNEERGQNARNLLETTDRLFAAESGAGLAGWLRVNLFPHIAPWVLGMNRLQQAVFDVLSQTGITYADHTLSQEELSENRIKAGDRMPYFTYLDALGNRTPIYDMLHTPRFRVVLFTAEIRKLTDFVKQNEEFAAIPDTAQIELLHVNTVTNRAEIKRIFGNTHDFLLVVRPDNYIGLQTADLGTERVLKYMREKLSVNIPIDALR